VLDPFGQRRRGNVDEDITQLPVSHLMEPFEVE
jgi:hypothetical protein